MSHGCSGTEGQQRKTPHSSGKKRDWNIDHTPVWTNRLFQNSTRKQVLNNQNGTRLECPSCNRSKGNRR
ncbi:GH-E family nuclease [Paenibacillus arenosi]|uniref:Toxin YqcG C-terminal domain-containing protein n=1 Tax=Paenibacillus arenosi TaxID=2774142 RepID=A0ABR9AW12_9BACL|nr:hypothetical protein [Paenibacillus arenosi]